MDRAPILRARAGCEQRRGSGGEVQAVVHRNCGERARRWSGGGVGRPAPGQRPAGGPAGQGAMREAARPGAAGAGCRWGRSRLSRAKARRSARGSGRGRCSRRRRARRAGGSPAWRAGRVARAGASSGVGGSTPGRRQRDRRRAGGRAPPASGARRGQGWEGTAGAAQRPERSGALSSPVPRSGSPPSESAPQVEHAEWIGRLFCGHALDASSGAGRAGKCWQLSTETVENARGGGAAAA